MKTNTIVRKVNGLYLKCYTESDGVQRHETVGYPVMGTVYKLRSNKFVSASRADGTRERFYIGKYETTEDAFRSARAWIVEPVAISA